MKAQRLLQDFAALLTRQICGISSFARGINVHETAQRVYFGNHSSHFDFLAIWAALPRAVRERTRPVAAKDYWDKPGLRGYCSAEIFRALYVERTRASADCDPLEEVKKALSAGDSVIIFPEGTRSLDGEIQPFKKGLYHLAEANSELEFVPVYLENLNRILPKGEVLIVPLMSRVIFGPALRLNPGEDKQAFIERARAALLELRV